MNDLVFERQIYFPELGYFSTAQIKKINKKLSLQLYRNISLIYQETAIGYILGLSTNINDTTDETLKAYFYKIALINI